MESKEARTISDRVRRVESKLCNLGVYLGCDLVQETTKRKVRATVHVTPGKIEASPSSTLGEIYMAVNMAKLTGTFDVYVLNNHFAMITITPESTHVETLCT